MTSSTVHHSPGTTTEPPAWTRDEILLIVASVILITVEAFEGLATTTIMPTVVADLGAESWFAIASGAVMCTQLVSTVVAGVLADARGPRPVLVAGMSLFTIGLLVSTFAPHISLFVLGRLILGLGGGLVIVALYVLIGAMAAPAHHPTFFAAFSLSWVLPGLVGPAIAGLVTLHFGWRAAIGSVPLIAIPAALLLIPVLSRLPRHEPRPAPALPRLTLLGVTAGLGTVALQLAGALGGWGLAILTLGGIAATAWALPKLLPTGALRLARGVPSVVTMRLLAMGALSGASAFLPLLLQRVHHWDAAQASLAVTVGTVSWSVGSTLQARVHSPKWRARLPFIGACLLLASLLPVAALVWEGMPEELAVGAWFFSGAGIGMLHSTASVMTLAVVPKEKHGRASSWLQVADAGGSAVELAVVSIMLALWALVPGVSGSHWEWLPAPVVALLMALATVIAARRATASR